MKKFIKLYIPFITAVLVAIHGIAVVEEWDTKFFSIFQNIIGSSVLYYYYVLIHSKRMCVWYKLSIKSLMLISILNICTKLGLLNKTEMPKLIIILSVCSAILWVLFYKTYKCTKKVNQICKDLDTE